MANQEHVDVVRSGADAIEAWLKKHPHGRFDLDKAELRNADLRGADLRRASMQRADFRGADLSGANFGGVFADHVTLSETDLSRATLSRAVLQFARLNGAMMNGANLSAAHLPCANLRGSNLSGASLIGTNLGDANLTDANLSRADMSGAYLDGGRLHRTDLSHANLSSSILDKAEALDANLDRANLRGARLFIALFAGSAMRLVDLRGAVLTSTNLIAVDLTQASLNQAELEMTRFTNCKLDGTTFRGAKLSHAEFNCLDLSTTQGLERVTHLAPSSVGVDTLQRSNGKIPHEFLHGCGFTDELTVQVAALVGCDDRFYSAFISYSHNDEGFARRLHDELQDIGIRCWLDDHAIRAGENIRSQIDRGVRIYDKTILCASGSSLASQWVEGEIDTALDHEVKLREERGEEVLKIIPLDLDGQLLKHAGAHSAALRKRNAVDFVGWESDNAKFDAGLEKVVAAMKATPRPPEPEPKL